jgi:uncharacterized membrane protein YphA (DoxX/SURF4 family)
VLSTIAAFALGAVFVVSGISKLSAPERWRAEAAGMVSLPGVPAVLPMVEVGLGALLVAGWQRRIVALSAGALVVAFTVLLVVRIRQGRRPPCACFGTLSTKPIGWGHVARNVVFMALAVIAAA